MARIRSVKPEICESETMARLSAEVERTFVRLWTHCDDDGRCKDDPRLIVAALFPLHDDVTAEVVDEHLHRLADVGVIVRYEVDGKRYLACTSWDEHQHPQRPRKSKIPAPSANSTRRARDVLGPVVVVGEVEGEGGVVTHPPNEPGTELELAPAPGAPATPAPNGYPDDFEAFWKVYPRKTGKGAAAKAFQKALRQPTVTAERITDAARTHGAEWASWPTSEHQFIPHPATWLNEARYDDPPPEPRGQSGPVTKADRNEQILRDSERRMGVGR